MSRKILVLEGHPAAETLNAALADAYAQAARESGHEVRIHRLSAMRFNPDLGIASYRNVPELEPDLAAFYADLEWCGHFVITHPMWWGGMPAKLKGLIDRVFLPGKTFQYQKGKPLPLGLMSGRSSRVIMTSDTPNFFLDWIYGNGIGKQTSRQILKFCGFKPARFTRFAPVRKSSEARRAGYLAKVRALGSRGD
ncbi:NAD(P)H-dependent oxidoreductase [Roseibium suaedae]|uniref:Putative NADPH-quinone reductase (Modulator of drug activity B) n=1 Tax=Roseibium suaedae TaxID=735517 RepID=A0A1M7C9L4_9HYPH|nr:NAD(P)H-dependent oxidoreductase [Roseibium suaedae]SHL63901.1 Putative NADPH-quinone reductase (modulator of drug activity B) [Roseibium suaedae]